MTIMVMLFGNVRSERSSYTYPLSLPSRQADPSRTDNQEPCVKMNPFGAQDVIAASSHFRVPLTT
jgi:hypothetical protein